MRRKKAKSTPFILLLLVTATIILGVAYKTNITGETSLPPNTSSTAALHFNNILLEEMHFEYVEDTKELYLVNKKHFLKNTYDEFETVLAFKSIPVSKSSLELQYTAIDNLKEWFAAGDRAGYRDFYATSGYRDYEYQKNLYEDTADKSYVQPPGASEHHTGFAVDIGVLDISTKHLDTSPEGQWLYSTAKEYGFILRYPKDKENITEISYESWHFRYVGLPHSYVITENNFCLEEYIDYIKNEKEFSITIGKTVYTVYYTLPKDGIIQVPQAMEYTASKDNTEDGGYIITVINEI